MNRFAVSIIVEMYLKIKYNAFYKNIINDTTTAINTCKYYIGGNIFLLVKYKQGRIIYYLLKVNKYWHCRKGWGKKSNTMNSARSFNR